MLTVAHLIDSFYAHNQVLVKTGQMAQSTAEWYRYQVQKLRKAAAAFPAAELRAHHLISVEFTYHFVRALKAIYKWGAEEELIPKTPFAKLKTPMCGQRNRTLKRPEMVRLYRAAPRAFRRFLFLMAHTLARPGEIRRLKWIQVRFDDRVIQLGEFKAKNKRRDGVKVRLIPLDLPAVRMLRNLWERQGRPGPDANVILGRSGRPWGANALPCQIRRARARAGLDDEKGEGEGERVVCYTMRHTGATDLTRKGIRDNALARIMGHTSTRTTARYQHLDPTDLLNILDDVKARRPK